MICKLMILWEFVLKKYYLRALLSTPENSTVSELLNDTAFFIWLAYNAVTKVSLWTCADDIAATLNCYINIYRRHDYGHVPKARKWVQNQLESIDTENTI